MTAPGGTAPAALAAREACEVPRLVGLLAEEPVGLIATRTAGAADLRATLSWPHPEDVRPPLPGPLAPSVQAITETANGITLCLEKRILAPTERELGAALDALMRATAAYAALAEAVLEVATVCTVPPKVASRPALEALARDLCQAGFPARFAPSCALAAGADVWVGTGGTGGDLEEYLRSHPRWQKS